MSKTNGKLQAVRESRESSVVLELQWNAGHLKFRGRKPNPLVDACVEATGKSL